jgi:hypothetical protein
MHFGGVFLHGDGGSKNTTEVPGTRDPGTCSWLMDLKSPQTNAHTNRRRPLSLSLPQPPIALPPPPLPPIDS